MKTALGELEQKVMDVVWNNKACSARDVLSAVGKDKKLAYTTIATILKRLLDKGLLNRKVSSTGHIYSPKVSKEEYSKNVAKNIIGNFINSFGDTAIASFADGIDKLPEMKRREFLKLIKEHDRNNKR